MKRLMIIVMMIFVCVSVLLCSWTAEKSAVAQSLPGPVVIAVDPYGGGTQTGVVGLDGLEEKTLTLAMARLLVVRLEACGFEAVLLRERDVDLPFPSRMMRAVEADADLILSLQMGGAVDSEIRGSAVFLSCERDQTPGGMPLRRIGVLMADTLQAVAEESSSRGVIITELAPQYKGEVPVVMVEAAMITNQDDARLISDPDGQARAAEAIAQGVVRAYQAPRIEMENEQ